MRALDLEVLRTRLSWAGQDPHLFDATLRDNLFAEGESDARLTALLHKLGLGDLLARLPGGLDAWVGEHGAQLSGGERARIALARALLKPSTVLLLDEPTAHLDGDAERAVMCAVLEELGERSLLLITHRPGALVGMDHVVRLEARGFVERRPHPSDRRSVLVHYLPQEPRVVGRMYSVLGRFQAAADSLSEAERTAVAGFLDAMADAVMDEITAPKK